MFFLFPSKWFGMNGKEKNCSCWVTIADDKPHAWIGSWSLSIEKWHNVTFEDEIMHEDFQCSRFKFEVLHCKIYGLLWQKKFVDLRKYRWNKILVFFKIVKSQTVHILTHKNVSDRWKTPNIPVKNLQLSQKTLQTSSLAVPLSLITSLLALTN